MHPQRRPLTAFVPFLSLVLILCLTPAQGTVVGKSLPTAISEAEPEPTPDSSTCGQVYYYKQLTGCLCYMRFRGFLIPFDNGTRKEIYCTGGFDLTLPETRKFCRPYIINGTLRPRLALLALDRFAFNCGNGSSILTELPEDSKYRSLFE